MKSLKVLIISTSHKTLNNECTDAGVWLQEIADPYYIFKDRGELVTICSPAGGDIPIDTKSEIAPSLSASAIRFKNDDAALYHLHHSLPLKEVDEKEFDMVLIAGGHGSMHDLVDNFMLNNLLQQFIEMEKPIGALGSGVVTLLSLKNKDGSDYIKDKRVTAYSNEEVVLEGVQYEVPFMLESQLLLQGASYSRARAGKSHVITEGKLLTGQNPASSSDLANALLNLARKTELLYESAN